MVEPGSLRKGLTRNELAMRILYIYEKKDKGEPLSKIEERIFAYHETANECRCKRG